MTKQIPARADAIERAAMIVGGVPELARRLNVAERQLYYWMRNFGTPPDTMFFDVFIIIENAGERVAVNDGHNAGVLKRLGERGGG